MGFQFRYLQITNVSKPEICGIMSQFSPQLQQSTTELQIAQCYLIHRKHSKQVNSLCAEALKLNEKASMRYNILNETKAICIVQRLLCNTHDAQDDGFFFFLARVPETYIKECFFLYSFVLIVKSMYRDGTLANASN